MKWLKWRKHSQIHTGNLPKRVGKLPEQSTFTRYDTAVDDQKFNLGQVVPNSFWDDFRNSR